MLTSDPAYPGIILGTIVKCSWDSQKLIAYAQIQKVTGGQLWQAIFGTNPGENNFTLIGTSVLFIPGDHGGGCSEPQAFIVERESPFGS